MDLSKNDIVIYRGRRCRVENVRWLRGIAGPHVRLSECATGEAVEEGQLLSHKILRMAANNREEGSDDVRNH